MLRVPTGRPRIDGTLSLDLNSLENCRAKTSHGNAEVWKAWKAIKPAFHSSHTPWKSLRGFPHYHGYGDDYHVSEDRQSPPKTRNQSHSHRKGLVNHVPGLKRKGCPGTLKDTKMWPFAPSNIWRISMQTFDSNWRPRRDLNPCYRRERKIFCSPTAPRPGSQTGAHMQSSYSSDLFMSASRTRPRTLRSGQVCSHLKEQATQEDP